VAVLPFASAAAGAGLVATTSCVADGVCVHDLGWRSVGREQVGHRPHRFLYVMEEELERRAEVVQARLAVGSSGKAILRAASMAGEANVTLAAVARERVALVKAELPLLLGGNQIDEVPVGDVAQQVARLDEVIARVDVTGVLKREREPTGLTMHAQARTLPDPVRQRRVEHLHIHARDIAPTHSSKTSTRNRPYPSGVTERPVTISPSCRYSGRSRHEDQGTIPSLAASATRSIMGMNRMKRAPHSSRRKRYTSRPRCSFAA